MRAIYGMIFNSRGNCFQRDKLDAILMAGFFGYGLVTGIEFKKKLTDIGFGFGFSWIGKWLFSMDLDF